MPAARPAATTSEAAAGLVGTGGRRWGERTIVGILFVCASVALLATLAIFLVMAYGGAGFLQEASLSEFLFGTQWAPDAGQFGSIPLMKGTFQVALGAIAFGVPLGVGSALYVSEFASGRMRRVLKPTLELLAGIPSIVFGLVALFILSPLVQQTFPGTGVFNALSATLALGVMVIPIIAAISEDALRAVPLELREASLALGANRWETTWKVVLPAARSGITASVILGFSRAIGETMAVTLAAGGTATLTWNYLEQAQTMTAFIATRAKGDLPTGSTEYVSIFALGLVLFVITFVINLVAQAVLARQRRRFG